MQIVVGGSPVNLVGGASPDSSASSLNLVDAVEQRSICSFSIDDPVGSQHYAKGQPVAIFDDTSTLIYSGFIETCDEQKPSPGASTLIHTPTCIDNHYLADKRSVAASYVSQTCGFIANDILNNYLVDEGVYAIRNLLSANQSDVETDTTGFSNGGTGVTLSRDTAQFWHGAASLKVVCDGTVTSQGFFCVLPSTSYQPGVNYQASIYMRGAGTVKVILRQTSPTVTLGQTTVTLTSAWQRVSVPFTTPNPLVATNYGFRVGTTTASAVTYWADGLMIEPQFMSGLPASAWELGGTSTIQAGPVVPQTILNYATAAACYDALALQAQTFTWYIDEFRRFWFGERTTTAAPWGIVESGGVLADVTTADNALLVTHGNPLYLNSKIMVGVSGTTTTQTEQRIGDGATQAWAMQFPLDSAPTVTVNGVSQTVGLKGASGFNFYWAPGDAVVAQDPAGTKLVSTQTLQVVYIGQFQAVVMSQDNANIADRAATEGGTSGIVDDVTQVAQTTTVTQAFQTAASALAKYGVIGRTVKFSTKRSGLRRGQVMNLTVPEHNLNGDQLFIESITTRDSNGQFLYYDVIAVEGPVGTDWANYFAKTTQAATQSAQNQVNVGVNSALIISASFTEAFSVAATLSATVIGFWVCGPSTIIGPSLKATVGSPTVTAVQITDAGLNLLRDAMKGAAVDPTLQYVAFGTGTATPSHSDTQLATEVYRQGVSTFANGAAVGELLTTCFLGPGSLTGTTIQEVGWFIGAASGTPNSGTLLGRVLYSHAHTALESIQTVLDSTL